jgi:hypothetical protein
VQRRRATKAPKAARTQPKPALTPVKPDDDELAELLGDTPPQTALEEEGGERPTPTVQHGDGVGQPPPEPDPPITKPQLTKLHTTLSSIGIESRENYLILCQAIIGYDVASTKNLTKNEARQLIDTLDNWATDLDYPIGDRINDILNTAALEQAAQEEPQ